jgi:hypothetical protein
MDCKEDKCKKCDRKEECDELEVKIKTIFKDVSDLLTKSGIYVLTISSPEATYHFFNLIESVAKRKKEFYGGHISDEAIATSNKIRSDAEGIKCK